MRSFSPRPQLLSPAVKRGAEAERSIFSEDSRPVFFYFSEKHLGSYGIDNLPSRFGIVKSDEKRSSPRAKVNVVYGIPFSFAENRDFRTR